MALMLLVALLARQSHHSSQRHQGEKWHSIGVTAAIARQKHAGAVASAGTGDANNFHSLNVNMVGGSPEQEAAF